MKHGRRAGFSSRAASTDQPLGRCRSRRLGGSCRRPGEGRQPEVEFELERSTARWTALARETLTLTRQCGFDELPRRIGAKIAAITTCNDCEREELVEFLVLMIEVDPVLHEELTSLCGVRSRHGPEIEKETSDRRREPNME